MIRCCEAILDFIYKSGVQNKEKELIQITLLDGYKDCFKVINESGMGDISCFLNWMLKNSHEAKELYRIYSVSNTISPWISPSPGETTTSYFLRTKESTSFFKSIIRSIKINEIVNL